MKKLLVVFLCSMLLFLPTIQHYSYAESKNKPINDETGNVKFIEKKQSGEFRKSNVKGDNLIEIKSKGIGSEIFEGNNNRFYLEVKTDYFIEAEEVTILRTDSFEKITKEYGVRDELAYAIIDYFELNDQLSTVVYKPIGNDPSYFEQNNTEADNFTLSSSFISRNYYTGYKNYNYMAEYWYKGNQVTGWHNFVSGQNPRSYAQNMAKYIASVAINAVESKMSFPGVTLLQILGVTADQVYSTGYFTHLIYLSESITEKWVYIYVNNTYTMGYKGQSANIQWSHELRQGVSGRIGPVTEPMLTVLTADYLYPDIRAYNFWQLGGYFECFDYQQYNVGPNSFNFDSMGD